MGKWTYKGGCTSWDEDCCYWNGETEKEFFETQVEAQKEADRRFPSDDDVWWHEVFEVRE